VPEVVVGVSGADRLLFRNGGGGVFALQVPSPLPRPAGFSGATTKVVVGDVDRIAGDDVVVLHDGAEPQLFLLQGSGGFAEQGRAWFPRGFLPQSPAAVLADFTSDGFLDMVVIQRGVTALPLLLASQSGSGFAARSGAFNAMPFAATVVAGGDVTQDGVPDVVLAASAAAANGVRVLANNGQGVFAPAPVLGFSTSGVHDLVIARIDGDPLADLAILHVDGSVAVSLAIAAAFGSLRPALPRCRADRGALSWSATSSPTATGICTRWAGTSRTRCCSPMRPATCWRPRK
jgi:hypothetical protein